MTSLGMTTVTWYPVMYLLAIAGGSGILIEQGRRRQFGSGWMFAVFAWAIGGVVGAAAPHAWLGDLVAARTAVGAVAGATLAIFLTAMLLEISPAAALDTTATAVPLAGALARLGCFAAGCCQGVTTTLPIGIAGDDGIRRHPTQLYEAAFDVIVAIGISRSRSRRLEGHRFLASLAAMCVGRFTIEFLRDSDKIGPLSLAQWVVGPVALIAAVMIAKRIELPRPRRRMVAATALALQMPVISGDTLYPRDYISLGSGWFGGSFDWTHEVGGCDVRESWTRHHQIRGMSGEFGYRRELSGTRGFGFRLRPFSARETASESGPFMVNGGPVTPTTTLPGYTLKHRGATIAGDFDFKYVGLTVGGTFGEFYPLLDANDDDNDHRTSQARWPSMGVRLGTRRVALEMRVGDEAPTGAPLPAASIGLALGDKKGTRVRLGATDMGGFIALQHVTPFGLELDPMVGSAHQGWLAGVMVKQWVRMDQKR